ncbi:Protein SPIRRIG, partial [Mucuna pruriens]
MAKELSAVTEEKTLNDCDDTCSSQNTFSSLPLDQDQSVKTSISVGSFPQGQVSTSSDDMAAPLNSMAGERSQNNLTVSELESNKSVHEGIQTVQSLDGDNADQGSVASSAHEFSFHSIKGNLDILQPTDSQSSASFAALDSPIFSEKSSARIPLTPSSSPVVALSSWLGSANHNEAKSPLTATPSFDSAMSAVEFDPSSNLKASSQGPFSANANFAVTSKLLLDIDDSGYGGGPCSAGATAVLDFIAEVLSDFVTEQVKASQLIENILESVHLYVDGESVLVFQGLCLSRFINFLERRLLRDDEEDEKKLDKIRWSSNLDALCWMIVDRVHMGAFPQPSGVLKTLEFLLSMLQLANKDGRIEEAAPVGKRLLSISRGSKQLEAYIHSILKNTNRMILYCFLPTFLVSIGEDDLLLRLGLLNEPKKRLSSTSSQDDSGIDINTVLHLLIAHRRIIFCPSNIDTDLNCCLCVNLISLLHDKRQYVQNVTIDVFKYLLVHRRAALEDLLVSRPNQGQQIDVLHGGFDKLLTRSLSEFLEWYQNTDQVVNKVLEQCAGIMWVQYIAGSAKFPGVRIKGMEGRRKKEMGRKSREAAKLDLRHWEQVNERRYALDAVRDAMSAELRVVRQDKYGWILHAESEWQCHLQQLVHERGIFPLSKSSFTEEPEWQLCPIEGPYRMRKKLECCKLKIDTVQNILDGQFELEKPELSKGKIENGTDASESKPYFQLLTDGGKQNGSDGELFDDPFFDKLHSVKDAVSDRNEWNDDKASSMNEASLHSALELGAKSSAVSVPIAESTQGRSEMGSPRQSSSMRIDDVKIADDKSDKELHDNGEYLIRPFLEPFEKIRFKYNCERVMGLDKHDGIFLIGEFCLYVIENFYIDDTGCFCEKECEDELSVIDQALGVKKDFTGSVDFQSKSTLSWSTPAKSFVGGRAWAYSGGAWGKEKVHSSGNLPHPWRMWKLDSVHEILKRDYQLRPVAIEIFSMDGCNDLLVFHKKEREEVFKNLVAINLPRNSMLDTTISGSSKQESNEGSRLFKIMAKSFSKRWQNGEISNFQYLMHLNTLAGRGYSDLTQYPVFPWVLADYDSENLDLSNPKTFRRLDKPMGCQTPEGEDEFRKRYESWDDPEVPKFHYGSHYSSAGIVLFYLLRLPPFSTENLKLQGGQFDHADRLFNSIRDTWLSAAGKGNTSDVKELIPEFFYMPEFLENRFNLDLGEKQSGEKVGDVILPPWAKGSAREFMSKHREALESDYVSENLHHWIDLIFGYKQRGKAAEESVNVFYHYTYEGSVDIDSVTDPAMKASILAQINHFGQTPKQLFLKPHVKRRTDRKLPPHPLKHSSHLAGHGIRRSSSPITQIVTLNDKILIAGTNNLLKPRTYTKYVAWGFPDRSLRFMSYEQDKLLSTHENLHRGNQIQCASVSHDGQILVTGADDGLVNVWRVSKFGPRGLRRLKLEKPLCGHTAKITCLQVSQPYMLIVSGSDDCTVIIWDLSSMAFVRQLPEFSSPVSAIFVNDLTGEIVTAAGILLAVWSINGDGLAMINTSQLPSDSILSVTSSTFSDWLDTKWYATGHQSGAVKVWQMIHCSNPDSSLSRSGSGVVGGLNLGTREPEYKLVLRKVLKFHKHPVTALHLTTDLKQLLSGDSGGHLLSWTLPEESLRVSEWISIIERWIRVHNSRELQKNAGQIETEQTRCGTMHLHACTITTMPTSILIPLPLNQGTPKPAFKSLSLLFTHPLAPPARLEHAHSLLLDICAAEKALPQGQQLHARFVKSHCSVFLATKLVHMYGKCGSLLDAVKVFDEMSKRTIFTWNAMMGAFISNGKYLEAIELYKEMRLLGVALDACSFPSVLKACGALGESRVGAEIHGVAVKCGFGEFVFVCNALIAMYAKCGDLGGARALFDGIMMEKEDTVSWNSIISAHVAQGKCLEALSLFRRMQEVGVASNTYTFVAALQGCEDPSFVKLGTEIHSVVLKSNHLADVYVANALIAMYAKCGQIEDAERVFEIMFWRDYVSWNTLLSGLVQNELYSDALNYFRDMQDSGQKPDQVSVLNLIAASGRLGNLLKGKEVHAYAIRNGLDSNMQIGNTLMDMYAKCCCVKYMGRAFECMPEKDLISWTTIIAGYAQNECHLEATNLFQNFQVERMDVDPMMVGSVLRACSGLKSKNLIKEIHGYVLRRDVADMMLQNAIVNVYGEVGHIDYARRVFKSIKSKDIVTWTSMITCCVHNGLAVEALELFYSLKQTNIQPDSIALISALSATASLSALKKGKEIHGFLIRKGFFLEGPIASSLVDMYARCGTVENSRKIFNSVKQRDIILWTSMINANGMHGCGNEAIALFKKMTDENVIPDHITFLALLYACSHSGLMVEGKRFFEIMKCEYKLEPSPEHYACMVDLLSRSNSLEEAYHFVRNMPIKPSSEVWCALLGACRVHSNKELGELAAKKLLQSDTENSGKYVLISNIFAADGRWNDVEEVRLRMKGNGLKKKPGCSWIEVKNKIHTFMARDKSHPQCDDIYLKLAQFTKLLEKKGYRAQTKFVFHNVSEEEKTQMLYGHSERLALGYGLLVNPKSTPIRITKNLRICDDCHTFFKIASEVSERPLVVRDANRFHHFERGLCSCRDFWRATLEDLLVSRPNQGNNLMYFSLHGGFDKLLNRSLSWHQNTEQILNKVLIGVVCLHYVVGSTRFTVGGGCCWIRLDCAMDLSEEWKSLFPIGASSVSPLLLSNSLPLGPLLFNPNPNPNSMNIVLSSPSLIPSIHLPPHLLPTRFLLSSNPPSILPSTASSVASLFTPQNDTASSFLRNRIHLLNYPDRPNAVLFFPTGPNDDKLAFFTLSLNNARLHIHLDANGDVFRASTGSAHRILNISVNSLADFGLRDDPCHLLGYLLASTLYSVHWFAVKHNSILERPSVFYLGAKTFKTCPVVHACWSPHILEESLVLLENGHLFLFDLESASFKGTRLRVPWNDSVFSENNKGWLSCEFSWHPRILIVARSDAVFLVDLRLKECSVSCLMKIETLRMYAPDENEQFLALSRAAPDNFYFAVASTTLLLLCDVRKPLLPVLQWMHGIEGPCFMSVFSLSMLRSHSREDAFKLASESGFCIILGSFWNCEFKIFCYGSVLPFRKGSITSKINPAICAWELPFEINLSGHECHCGSCLLRKEFSKDALPEWIDWQLKREIVLGFGVLSNDLAALLCEPDENGGFTLIRLMSSGKFELQRYRASWAQERNVEDCHDRVFCLDRHLLYPESDEKYKFPKIFHYLKLDHLYAYAGGNLTQFLVAKLKKNCMDAQDKEPFCAEVHELLCEKLNACGLGQSRSCPAVTSVFNDVKLPASLHEVALRGLWADLPMELLQLAFLRYAECHEVVEDLDQNRVSLEFLAVPDLPQLPPFFLRKSSPHSNDDIVGPVIPFPVLLVVNEFRNGHSNLEGGEFSVETELGLKFKEVMQVASEIAVSAYGSTHLDDHAVSLAEDGEETWVGSSKPKSFLLYHPVAFNSSDTDLVQGKSVYSDTIYDTFIFHVPEKKSNEQTESVGQEIFDELSPVELRFDAPVKKLEPQGLKAYNLLKRQMSKWQENFGSYKEFVFNLDSKKVVSR